MANYSFCENCGIPIPLGDTLCPSCAPQVQTDLNRHMPPPRQQHSGGNKLILPIIIGIVAIIIAVVAIFVVPKLFGNSEGDTPPIGDITEEQTLQEPSQTPSVNPPDSTEEEETPIEALTSCIACGASIPESAQFCPYCGKSQTAAEPEEEVTEEEIIEEEPEPITMERIESIYANPNSLGKVSVSSAYGTSVVSQSGNHDNTAGVTLDGDLTTSWQEGVTGSGVGEGIVYNLDDEYAIQYISFNLGNWRSTTWYAENNVPQALDIVINEEIYRVTFPYGQSKYWVALSEPVVTDCVEIYIAAAYPGSVYNDTCIAEVGIYGERS